MESRRSRFRPRWRRIHLGEGSQFHGVQYCLRCEAQCVMQYPLLVRRLALPYAASWESQRWCSCGSWRFARSASFAIPFTLGRSRQARGDDRRICRIDSTVILRERPSRNEVKLARRDQLIAARVATREHLPRRLWFNYERSGLRSEGPGLRMDIAVVPRLVPNVGIRARKRPFVITNISRQLPVTNSEVVPSTCAQRAGILAIALSTIFRAVTISLLGLARSEKSQRPKSASLGIGQPSFCNFILQLSSSQTGTIL